MMDPDRSTDRVNERHAQQPVGGCTLEVFGELGVWFVVCGVGAVGIFLLKRWPVVTTVLLVLLALGVAVLAFLVARWAHPHPEKRRWWNVVADAFVATFATASVLFLVTWGCSCP